VSTEQLMSKAVRFDDYGGIEVLEVRDVARPEPGPDQVLVAVRAAGINPSEAKIRAGLVREIFPATFPSGEGSDLAGVVEEVGAGVRGVAVGDEVIGYTNNRASHAEYVLVEAANLTAKPAGVPWEVAGALFVAGATGVATVRAVAPTAGEAVVIAGAGGGVGVFAVQLAVRTGARVIALASKRHHAWLRERGAVPVAYGDGVSKPITAVAEETPVSAFIDLVGGRLRRAGARARHRQGPDRHDRRLPLDREVGRQGRRRRGRGERGDPGRTGRGDRGGRPRRADPARLPAQRRSSGGHRARGRSHDREDRPHRLTRRTITLRLRPGPDRRGRGVIVRRPRAHSPFHEG
jgi:hypothetical protein